MTEVKREMKEKEKSMNQTKLSVSNLDLYYGNFHALKNINLELPEKEITAFIGPSGCGKTTLAKLIMGLAAPTGGQILLDGEDIYKGMDVNLLRRRVGMVFQKPNPFPMSIYDNIAYGPRTHGIRSKVKLDEIVEKALPRHERRAVAAALHCQSLGGAAGGASDG